VQTIKSILQQTPLDRIDARVLLHFVCQQHLGWDKSQLITHDQEELPQKVIDHWKMLENARVRGEPVAYLIHQKAFHGITLFINEHVLIPRPETELLVDLVIESISTALVTKKYSPTQAFKVLDLGTGSGAILLAVAKYFQKQSGDDQLQFLGTDVSHEALQVAQKNAANLNLNSIKWQQSHWFESIEPQYFDCIVANPPYIAANDSHLEQGDLRFEPQHALSDFADGLSAYQAILENISHYLRPHGRVFFEHGFEQGMAVRMLLQKYGFLEITTHQDLSGHERISTGRIETR
jgi:release factor glutamine methyltransferase